MSWYVPDGMYTLRDETRAELESALPFPAAWLLDHDYWGRGLVRVAEQGKRTLWRFNSGALMWTTAKGDQIKRLEFLVGAEAIDAWAKHGCELPAAQRSTLLAALAVGRDLDQALDSLYGRNRRNLVRLLEERDGEKLFAIGNSVPFRRGYLLVRTDVAGAIVEARLLSGVDGYRRFEGSMRRKGAWG
jgi:hypothetical protein